MREAQGGDALTSVVQSNLGPLRSVLIKRIGNEDDALDLLQDAFLRCAELGPDATIDNPRGYVWRLAMNLVVDYHRSRNRQQRLFCQDDAALGAALALHADPEEITASLRYLGSFRRAVAALPPDARRAYLLSRREGLTYEEIAREMGVSSNMVKKHIKRAIAVLRTRCES
ncbi:MAG: RNA polymerase sigma factor [Halieaceae bacterium]|jgi:RNA polymerase sigma-70 factor (ECF subfamily)|nr:RNA polymerase sigma factor [Halieaceae bacterium]